MPLTHTHDATPHCAHATPKHSEYAAPHRVRENRARHTPPNGSHSPRTRIDAAHHTPLQHAYRPPTPIPTAAHNRPPPKPDLETRNTQKVESHSLTRTRAHACMYTQNAAREARTHPTLPSPLICCRRLRTQQRGPCIGAPRLRGALRSLLQCPQGESRCVVSAHMSLSLSSLPLQRRGMAAGGTPFASEPRASRRRAAAAATSASHLPAATHHHLRGHSASRAATPRLLPQAPQYGEARPRHATGRTGGPGGAGGPPRRNADATPTQRRRNADATPTQRRRDARALRRRRRVPRARELLTTRRTPRPKAPPGRCRS